MAFDKNENAILIEPNMRKGKINLYQFSNGPLFSELTDIVMIEVFGRKNCEYYVLMLI